MVDRLNRFVLLLLGLLLAAAGALGLAASDGTFDDVDSPATIYRDVHDELVTDSGRWLLVVLGISGLVLVLALVWLWRQFASRPGGPHLSTVVLDAGRRGRTTLEPVGLARAIAQDLETAEGVRKATVRIRSTGREPAMWVRLTVDRAADPDELLERAEPAMQRAARSLDAPGVDARIRIDFAGRNESRVV